MTVHMLTDRETRLRERIDWLTDQRDRALADLHKVRAEKTRASARVRALEEQLDRWKTKALGTSHGRATSRRTSSSQSTTEPGSSTLDGTHAAGLRKEPS